MAQDALKLELIQWLTTLTNSETIEILRIVKNSEVSGQDWWKDLSDYQKAGIERGMEDIRNGRTILHDEVKRKYGL